MIVRVERLLLLICVLLLSIVLWKEEVFLTSHAMVDMSPQYASMTLVPRNNLNVSQPQLTCMEIEQLMLNGVQIGRGSNKVVYVAVCGGEKVAVKVLSTRSSKADSHKSALFWEEKAQRNFIQEELRLTALSSPYYVRFYVSRYDCVQFPAVSVVEYVPTLLHQVDVKTVPQCVFVALMLRLAQFVVWLEHPEPHVPFDSLARRGLVLCDWKLDQFGLMHNLELRLLDVDSLYWYHPLMPLNSNSKCTEGKERRMGRSCMGGEECLQHAVRVYNNSPAEFWCNRETMMCDGFDQPSNVWGLAQTIFEPLFEESGVLNDTRIGRPMQKLLTDMMAEYKVGRITAREVETTLQKILDTCGGEPCVQSFLSAGGISQNYIRKERLERI